MLVAHVLQYVLMDDLNIPFWATCALSILLIWLYTYRGGIRTIVFTDTLQTLFMLLSLCITIWLIYSSLQIDHSLFQLIKESPMSKIFHFEDANAGAYFWKQFIGGMFITIGMTGLDQDMMQKNLSCRNIGDAKKNMLTFASILVVVNLLFLVLGALLFLYANQQGIGVPELGGKPRTDLLFPDIAMHGTLGGVVTILFLLGLIAAAYSSADSALTALTTSAAIDFFDIEKRPAKQQVRLRKQLHAAVSVLLFVLMIALDAFADMSAIGQVILFAGFTYGPLIGLFFFGILTRRTVNDLYASLICFAVTIGCIVWYTTPTGGKIGSYQIGPELIALNGLVVYLGLWVGSRRVKL
jgi:Na+/proline symporter